ncbi:phosphonate ABC transporter, periplasmic phosphonate-binding protein [Magnetococcus marinus MC-1]|uniref:Phosphonate ABC transporter, periplasmic phosphonate-binding protein n=1 Tax=Magnetococcus marinus (strain ATCC BAA-1437 / JCM 17883 / MC-1) TaxID=156889 RepID=A0L5L2_MAGMM|nr:phosphate/phosphite/phosphonate ABC transporter substrate-binding protein [Magnetococcus marinus]ABK43255.1 phosphonate ABC transporter, periplasmic phosphonate-binding protein [Magnetococcus marinus MC-1]
MSPFIRLLGVAIGLLLPLFPLHAQEEKPLTLGFMPYLSSASLLEKYTPLVRYLGEQLGRPVHIKIARNYQEHIEQIGENKLDIAFLGGSPYVAVTDHYGKKPLLVRYAFDGTPYFRAVIVVSNNSPITSLDQLAGKRMAFGNINSTLSSQVPLYMIMQKGVRLAQLATYKHLRNHENVLLGVAFGEFDAGAVAEEVYRESMGLDLHLLATSPLLSTHLFVTRSDMPAALQARIRQLLMQLHTTEQGLGVLQSINRKLTAFVSVKDSDYDLHRTILREVLPVLQQP